MKTGIVDKAKTFDAETEKNLLYTLTKLKRLLRVDSSANRKAISQDALVIFTGASGTGKTLAAQILAEETKLPLFRVEFSAVISKYIGETEKNLNELFAKAQSNHAILYFDEADALFGNRSNIKGSHDRYSNIEIDYLIQRIESYEGIVILDVDKSVEEHKTFTKKASFKIEFPVRKTRVNTAKIKK
jgi:SpoVK/Ycf46/Vps4 family AAA+-type ATPase